MNGFPRVTKYTLNLAFPFAIAFAIYLGVSGKADWWIIALVFLTHVQLNVSWRA